VVTPFLHTIVEFNDDPFPGPAAAWGEITFNTATVPEPSSPFLAGIAAVAGLGASARRGNRQF
jgi:hypothetical protein